MKKKNRLQKNHSAACEAAEMLKATAHPLRLRIIALLCDDPHQVGELAALLDVKQAIVSQQLRILRMHRLVQVVRENGHSAYQLAEPRLKEFVRCVEGCTKHSPS